MPSFFSRPSKNKGTSIKLNYSEAIKEGGPNSLSDHLLGKKDERPGEKKDVEGMVKKFSKDQMVSGSFPGCVKNDPGLDSANTSSLNLTKENNITNLFHHFFEDEVLKHASNENNFTFGATGTSSKNSKNGFNFTFGGSENSSVANKDDSGINVDVKYKKLVEKSVLENL